jgi:hypothetical protein
MNRFSKLPLGHLERNDGERKGRVFFEGLHLNMEELDISKKAIVVTT